jgi:hypothetical protein
MRSTRCVVFLWLVVLASLGLALWWASPTGPTQMAHAADLALKAVLIGVVVLALMGVSFKLGQRLGTNTARLEYEIARPTSAAPTYHQPQTPQIIMLPAQTSLPAQGVWERPISPTAGASATTKVDWSVFQ